MIDQEKVIKGLECCGYIDRPNCADCPEDGPGFGYACRNDLMKKALALLKTQTQNQPNCNTAYHDAVGCLGFGHGEDDEPIDICKACEKYTGNREGGEKND